jgi:glucuronoarabinoxylan endo-1,4-beta-xylanase
MLIITKKDVMNKKIKNCMKNENHSFIFLIFCFILIPFLSQVHAQTFSVKGTITASTIAVQNASVTFIDNSDTTKKYSALTDATGFYQIDVITSVISKSNLPTKFQLEQNYPNPFSSSTNISYKLNQKSNVQVNIYDILGRVVRKFTGGEQPTGSHSIIWDGLNNLGEKLATGIYFYRVQAGGEVQVKKMIFSPGVKNSSGSAQLTYPSASIKSAEGVNVSIDGGSFKVKIENTSSTFPAITNKTIDDQLIQSDMTVNFTVATQIPVATVDINSTQQLIRGFGASNIIYWRPDMTSAQIQTAFGTGDGQLGFTILRIMVEPDSTRWSLYLPTALKAQSMGAIVIASPWYAPTSMDTTYGGNTHVLQNKYPQYANHLNSFVKYMTKNGVSIYGLSIQNEPDITGQWTSWTANEIFTFMHNYAGTIKGTRVMAPESFHYDHSYSDRILNDSAACANTNIICGHIYGAGLADYPLARQKGKEVWMTEYLIDSGMNGANMDTSWTAALATATSMNSCLIANMSAYVWWYIVRYYGPIGDGTAGFGQATGVVTRKGYVMSQFARFIRPGFYRISSNTAPQKNVSVSAYKDSTSKVVIVAINSGSVPIIQLFSMNVGTITTMTPYTTSASKNCLKGNTINVTNGIFTVTLDPSSITTFISN